MNPPPPSAARIQIQGIVQGVGFRPFVYNLARKCGVCGTVRNTSAGVIIEAEAPQPVLQDFIYRLGAEAPQLAKIDTLEVSELSPQGFAEFVILHSEAIPQAFQPISPDFSICPDCLRELFDPADRRYRYPFINCTNCGPRFTIIQDIPYDRPATTMAGFPMCPACRAEYENPADRRFHAQPIACPDCGPQVWLETPGSEVYAKHAQALEHAQRLLLQGRIVAIKGLGGFHLACNPFDSSAVTTLRQRKLRVDKPFAVMFGDLATIQEHCQVSPEEARLLTSPERPVVLLQRLPASALCSQLAPGQHTIGAFLPYTPLHHLLFAPPSGAGCEPLPALVMTSGNLSEEPIATDNTEARRRLTNIADAWLMHDRPIHIRNDDSVVRVFAAATRPATLYPMRRSRGYAPYPVAFPWENAPILACGAELKNTFCLTQGRYAFVSHHIGDLENYETLQSFESGIDHYQRLFRVAPTLLASDLHPDYLSTRYALERSQRQALPLLQVQHHHAHIAACMLENQIPLEQPVLGFSFDGTGYGVDGTIWGGEVLQTTYAGFTRLAHLEAFPLPGGELAIRQPWRIALGLLDQAGLAWDTLLPPVRILESRPALEQALRHQISHGVNSPLCSSLGRLFDGVASLAGIRQQVNFEGQAAIELEAVIDESEPGGYPLEVDASGTISIAPLILAVVQDVSNGTPPGVISARFHNALASLVANLYYTFSPNASMPVALSGGVWQNIALLQRALAGLEHLGARVLLHHTVPTNDGGISLGQAAVAATQMHL